MLKGRTCAGGRKKRQWKSKAESTSPTAHTESVLLAAIVDAYEERFVGISDVKGAYLNADFGEFLLIKFENEQVKIMCDINKKYKKYVLTKNRKQVLYIVLNKVLHDCVQSALLWYKMLSSFLIDMGFVLNPYDLCVANKVIDGTQCAIV